MPLPDPPLTGVCKIEIIATNRSHRPWIAPGPVLEPAWPEPKPDLEVTCPYMKPYTYPCQPLTGVCKIEIATNRPHRPWIPAYAGMTEWAR